ncbi:hypothetical protein PspLS_10084, partial [Pyricularia sp. CBS 133598]
LFDVLGGCGWGCSTLRRRAFGARIWPIGDRPSNSLLWFLHHLVLAINVQVFLLRLFGCRALAYIIGIEGRSISLGSFFQRRKKNGLDTSLFCVHYLLVLGSRCYGIITNHQYELSWLGELDTLLQARNQMLTTLYLEMHYATTARTKSGTCIALPFPSQIPRCKSHTEDDSLWALTSFKPAQ